MSFRRVSFIAEGQRLPTRRLPRQNKGDRSPFSKWEHPQKERGNQGFMAQWIQQSLHAGTEGRSITQRLPCHALCIAEGGGQQHFEDEKQVAAFARLALGQTTSA